MKTKKEIKLLMESNEKKFKVAKERYEKQKDLVRKACIHDWEKFSGYAGTDYCCKICGLWE
jgi:hypothetical protein